MILVELPLQRAVQQLNIGIGESGQRRVDGNAAAIGNRRVDFFNLMIWESYAIIRTGMAPPCDGTSAARAADRPRASAWRRPGARR